ncbi:MAG: hypothetical protein ACE37E_00270 [Hyphomicrobiales bacterium]
MIKMMQKSAFTVALSTLTAAFVASDGAAESLSNRHHLSNCTQQSAPVVIPYADARTVRLGLPADVGPSANIQQIYGWDEETGLRLRRQGVSLQSQGGSASLSIRQNDPC